MRLRIKARGAAPLKASPERFAKVARPTRASRNVSVAREDAIKTVQVPIEQAPPQKRLLLLLFVGAALTALTLVFPVIGFLEWITMIPLIVGAYRLCDHPSTGLWKSYLYGFFTVAVYYLVVYHWFVYLYPLDFVGLDEASSIAVVLAGWLGLTLLQAIPGGLIFLCYRLLCRSGAFDRFSLAKPFAFAALWVIFEWSSTLSWTGVPWGRLCIGQIDLLPMVQISSAFGSYAVSFLLLAVNGLLAYALYYHCRRAICIGTASALVLSNLLFGLIMLRVEPQTTDTVTAAVIQGNVNSHDKWDSDSDEHTREIYADLTRQAAEEGAELVIWPETALPYVLNEYSHLRAYVSTVARDCGVTLIVGALYADDEGEYNSLYLVTPDGKISEERYDKRHLVPFGEYVPMRDLIMAVIPPLANLSALGSDLSAGDGPNLFTTEWGSVGSMICFDSIYEMLGIDSVREGAELMLISSNDSWFYDSAAVYQHEVQARFRAIEEGRYLLRAANTGISAIITPRGDELAVIEPLVDGYAVREVHCIAERTLYSYIGNLLVYLCIAFCLMLPCYAAWRRSTERKKLN